MALLFCNTTSRTLNFYYLHSFLVENLKREAFLFYVTWYFLLSAFLKALIFKIVGYQSQLCKAWGIGLLSEILILGSFVSWLYSDWPKPFSFEWVFAGWLGFNILANALTMSVLKPASVPYAAIVAGAPACAVTTSALLLLAMMTAFTLL